MPADILSNLIITRFYFSTTMHTEEGVCSKRVNRPYWAVIIKYEGETVYTFDEKKYLSNINNMVILPKGCSYEWQCTQKGHYCVIEFDSDLTFDGIIHFPDVNGEKFLRVFKDMEYKSIEKKPMYELECMRDTYSLILNMSKGIKAKYVPGEKRSKIAPALEYIAQNYNKKIKNDELAKITDLSTVYFRKLFTELTGTSPVNYIHQLRIKKAKEMLKTDYGSISDIAYSLGYLNVYDFSRDFKKRTGIPPSNY